MISWESVETPVKDHLKAMDDIGVVVTPFGDVVTVILVVNSYHQHKGVGHVDWFYKVARGNDKN